jgi:hypothetical protein
MLTTIFYYTDEFCKFFSQEAQKHSLPNDSIKPFQSSMSLSEIMTIMIYWHQSGYKNFKSFYTIGVLVYLRGAFPHAVSYNRFLELIPHALFPLFVFAKCTTAQCTGKSFIDSTKLSVCNNKRISSHKVFRGMASRGKTSMGWFFGFKLHLITDEYGNIVDFTLSTGSVHDSNKTVIDSIIEKVIGFLVGDKGYVGLFEHLYDKGIKLLHRLRGNMKNKLVTPEEKMLLQKRGSIIETSIGILKNHLSLEHSRHRSPINFLCHICSCLISYAFFKAHKRLNSKDFLTC